jgi:hypothetical protein
VASIQLSSRSCALAVPAQATLRRHDIAMCLSIVLRMRLCRRVPAVRHISTEMETLATHVQSAPRAYEPRIHSASRLKRPWSRTLHQFGPHTVLTLLRPAIASQQGHSSPVQMQCGVNRSALLHSKRGICQGPSSPLCVAFYQAVF